MTILGFLGYIYPELGFLGRQVSLGYYVYDLLRLMTNFIAMKEDNQSRIYFLHHLMTIMIIFDSLSYTLEQDRLMSLVSLSMNISSVILTWRYMAKDPILYKGYYPNLSSNTIKILFAINFFLFRIILGFPLIFYILSSFPVLTQYGLSLSIIFNSYWASQIIRIALKSKGSSKK